MRRLAHQSTLCVFVLGLWPALARADDTHYQNYLTGGRSVGLGGAFTALGNDPSGLVYNPAGLVDDVHTDVSLSADLYGFERSARDGASIGPTPPITNLTELATDLVIIPTASGLTRTFQSDKEGGYLNAISLGVFVPQFRSLADTYRLQDASGLKEYTQTLTDRTLMPGVGYARKIGKLRLGISTFYVLRSFSSQESSTLSTSSTAFSIGDASAQLVAGSLQWILGAKWVPSSRLSLGAALTLPDISVNSTGVVHSRHGVTDPSQNGSTNFQDISLTNLSSGYRAPTQLRLGAALQAADNFLISTDTSIVFASSYDLLRVNDTQAQAVLPFVQKVNRRAVVNINAGVEWQPFHNITVGGGFFTDFASSDDLSGSRYANLLPTRLEPSVDNYGFSAVMGFISDNTITRVGVLYAAGSGYDVVARDDVLRLSSQQQDFERVKVFNSFFYIFISSTLRFL